MKTSCPAPECGSEFDIEQKVAEGDVISCPVCSSDLEVVATMPIELKPVADELE
jgi:lysine biosynthesis protein LysW